MCTDHSAAVNRSRVDGGNAFLTVHVRTVFGVFHLSLTITAKKQPTRFVLELRARARVVFDLRRLLFTNNLVSTTLSHTHTH